MQIKRFSMNKLPIFVCLFLLTYTVSNCQPVIVHAEINPEWKNVYRRSAPKINDLVHTKLDVKFDFTKSWLVGQAWLTLSPHFYPTDTLRLDAKGMVINGVYIITKTKQKTLEYTYDSLELLIKLDRIYNRDEEYTVFIDYISKPDEFKGAGSAAITGAKGLYFINATGKEKGKPTQIWTQGETESNSVWMPTIDRPNQKTTEEITMTVPANFQTLSNGLMVSSKNNGNGTRSDTWQLDKPHAPYLFFIGAGEFSVVKDTYEGKEVSYFVEKEYEPVARKIFGNTPEMMHFFSKKLDYDYPWPKYSQMVGRDYVSGAMENTTATLHQESAYQNSRELLDGNEWEHVIAHELFHHWFGDLVTSESWSNLTVSESFADFSETMWIEYKYGKDAGAAYNYDAMKTYFMSGDANKNLVRFYYKDKEDMFDAVSYQKGGRILNMLRAYLGDDAFFSSLNRYLNTYQYKTAEAHQLRLSFEDVTGEDLNWFWNQWYFGSGHPEVEISYLYQDSVGKAKVIFEQLQNGYAFRLPVMVDVYSDTGTVRLKKWIVNKADTVIIDYVKRPNLINVDAQKVILWEKTDHKTADNYRLQYRNAPQYLDRREALEFFGKMKMPELAWGLTDTFSGLRKLTLDLIVRNQQTSDEKTIALIESIAQNDKDRKTKAKALEALAGLREQKYLPLFRSYLFDSSYSISGSALAGFAILNPDSAYTMAKMLAVGAKGNLSETVNGIIISTGNEDDFDYLYEKIKLLPFNQEKFNLVASFGVYLTKIHDREKIKKGIDEIFNFKQSVPEDYRSYTDPVFDEVLKNIGISKKGEIKQFIEDKR